MGTFLKRSTQEFERGSPSPLRLLVPMLTAGALAAGGTYYALGLRTRSAQALPELVLRIDGDVLHLPDGTSCPLSRGRSCAR
jgi:hypothetical protein